MLLATWNVNSIRAREARLRDWLAARKPDVVCLQELKCEVEQLPAFLREEGWHVTAVGQKTYNGVAVLSRSAPAEVRVGLADGQDGEGPEPARLIAATIDGVRVVSAYFPNGGQLGSDKYQYKLRWMQRLRAWLDRWSSKDLPLALCGDFNVAPEPRDVHEPAKWESTVLYTPEVRARLAEVQGFGLVDAYRLHHQGSAFSWWDYRAGAFRKDQGLRIDHIYVTEPLRPRVKAAEIDRAARAGDGASDHAPVLAWIE
jgi:exodeoxyribonuclease-3